jgi:hypothetical protein
LADHSMLQVEGAVWRRAMRRPQWKPLGVRGFRAFDDRAWRGTADMVRRAETAGVPVHYFGREP